MGKKKLRQRNYAALAYGNQFVKETVVIKCGRYFQNDR
jgi:hypothetical protein